MHTKDKLLLLCLVRESARNLVQKMKQKMDGYREHNNKPTTSQAYTYIRPTRNETRMKVRKKQMEQRIGRSEEQTKK